MWPRPGEAIPNVDGHAVPPVGSAILTLLVFYLETGHADSTIVHAVADNLGSYCNHADDCLFVYAATGFSFVSLICRVVISSRCHRGGTCE